MSYKQREHYRVPIQAPVRIHLGKDMMVQGTCRDISMGGMGLILNRGIEPKSCGLVTMRYEQHEKKVQFSAKFTVVWALPEDADQSKNRAGIKFIEIDECNRTNLAQILLKQLQTMESTSTETV